MKRLILALVFMVTAPFAIYAADCGIRRCVVAPAQYVAPVRANQYHRKAVVVQEVEVHRDHYYSIDNSYQQSLLADAIVGRLLRSGLVKVPDATERTGGRSPTGPVARPSATGDGDKPVTQETKAGVYQNATLLKVVTDSCVKCHGKDSKYSRLLTDDGKFLADLPAGKVFESFALVNTGEMPKTADALPDDQVKLFYEWAKNARK